METHFIQSLEKMLISATFIYLKKLFLPEIVPGWKSFIDQQLFAESERL